MTAVLLAALAATGARLLVHRPPPSSSPRRLVHAARRSIDESLAQAGLAEVDRWTLLAAVAGFAAVGGIGGLALFGAPLPALVTATAAGGAPIAGYRRRRRTRRAVAMDAWPRIIEEIRVLCGSAGRSIPQAVLDAGSRAPGELRPAFEAAGRTWRLTTDLDRTSAVLKSHLADPTCDATCETLLVAHQLGGTDVEQRLEALAADRRLDAQCRKDARAQQAGVRFARRFVLLVPLGMAAAGLTVGDGRAAYQTPLGQVVVIGGLALVGVCWLWAGRLLQIPQDVRVFDR